MKYEWKDGAHSRGMDANDAGKALERIRKKNDGDLTAEAVLEAARRESSPLHAWFTWDDTLAARQYRLEQARSLIRSVTVRIVGDHNEERTMRAFVNLGKGPEYEEIHEVLASPDRRGVLLQRFYSEMERLRRKFGDMEEIAAIFEAVDASRRIAA